MKKIDNIVYIQKKDHHKYNKIFKNKIEKGENCKPEKETFENVKKIILENHLKSLFYQQIKLNIHYYNFVCHTWATHF